MGSEAAWRTAFQYWARQGCLTLRRCSYPSIDWRPVRSLIEALTGLGRAQSQILKRLTDRSGRSFPHLGDPLRVDFGAHRWFRGQREESYSDWLAWLIGFLSPAEVLSTLGIGDKRLKRLCRGLRVAANREEVMPADTEGDAGRFDLVIRFRDALVVLVEAKLRQGQPADRRQLKKYRAWLDGPEARDKRAVFLVPEAVSEPYPGWTVRRWADVCVELRRVASRMCRQEQTLPAAMTLAFVAAVEQNVLGFEALRPRTAPSPEPTLMNPRMIKHLEAFLAGVKR